MVKNFEKFAAYLKFFSTIEKANFFTIGPKNIAGMKTEAWSIEYQGLQLYVTYTK